MSKPFNATMRKLTELEPAAWLRFLHIPAADPGRVMVIECSGCGKNRWRSDWLEGCRSCRWHPYPTSDKGQCPRCWQRSRSG